MLGQPIFPGENGVDQLVEIIKILGTPTKEQIQAMNPNYTEFRFPIIKPCPWNKVSKPPAASRQLLTHSPLLPCTLVDYEAERSNGGNIITHCGKRCVLVRGVPYLSHRNCSHMSIPVEICGLINI